MLPSGSLATLDTWPSVHPFGMCSQDGSTANFGTSTSDAGRGGAAEAWCDPAITNAKNAIKTIPVLTHNFRFTFMIRILLSVSPCDCSDSTGSTPFNRYFRFGLWFVHRTLLLPWTQRTCHQSRPRTGPRGSGVQVPRNRDYRNLAGIAPSGKSHIPRSPDYRNVSAEGRPSIHSDCQTRRQVNVHAF